jgi:hypothetical protein
MAGYIAGDISGILAQYLEIWLRLNKSAYSGGAYQRPSATQEPEYI